MCIRDRALTIGAGRSIVPSESPEELRIISEMNHAIFNALKSDTSEPYNIIRYNSMNVTINKEKRDDQEYQVIRHGAQVSYLAHMLAEEKSEAIIYTVADKTHKDVYKRQSTNSMAKNHSTRILRKVSWYCCT